MNDMGSPNRIARRINICRVGKGVDGVIDAPPDAPERDAPGRRGSASASLEGSPRKKVTAWVRRIIRRMAMATTSADELLVGSQEEDLRQA